MEETTNIKSQKDNCTSEAERWASLIGGGLVLGVAE
jgi:hypothetical protein